MPEAAFDLSKLPEDERIRLIGTVVMEDKKISGCFVSDKATADRYMRKLTARFPGIREIARIPMPELGKTIFLRIGPPLS